MKGLAPKVRASTSIIRGSVVRWESMAAALPLARTKRSRRERAPSGSAEAARPARRSGSSSASRARAEGSSARACSSRSAARGSRKP